MPDQDQNPGHHDGYAGEPGTYLLKDGKRVLVDAVTLEPIPETQPDPEALSAADENASAGPLKKNASTGDKSPTEAPLKKTAADVNKTE